MRHAPEDSLLATYYLETRGSLAEVAETLAVLETTGGWEESAQPADLLRECTGEVYEVQEEGPGKGTVTLCYPLVNLNLEESAFSSLFLYLIGGATHALTAYEKSRLIDFHLPDWALRYFPGPQFGMEGTRQLLCLEAGEPVIGAIVKPTAGLTPPEVAELCGRLAAGGVRFIKDDEKMMNPPYCPLPERVRLVAQAIERAQERTGKKVLYAPHITTAPANLSRFAETAVRNGATALMVNFFAGGFHSLEMLAQNGGMGVPVYAHCGGKEAFGREPGQGVGPEATAKMARLMGGDYFRVGALGGYMVGGTREEMLSLAGAMRQPMGQLRRMVPVISGGVNSKNLKENLELLGCDVFALAGTGITRHPGGIACAVEEMLAIARSVTAPRGG